jgi:ribosomal protein S27E
MMQSNSRYIQFKCPECSNPLIIYSEFVGYENYHSSHKILIRHCNSCGCDWENDYWEEFGDTTETKLRRKFWG